jgi:hypothetical protein
MREGISAKQREMNTYDKAINEIESTYGHIIFSEDFFADEGVPESGSVYE